MVEILREKNRSVVSHVTRPTQISYKHTHANPADWMTASFVGSYNSDLV